MTLAIGLLVVAASNLLLHYMFQALDKRVDALYKHPYGGAG